MSIHDSGTVLLITNNGMGHAGLALQQKLIGTYFTLMLQGDIRPAAICFYTEGVRLAVEGSPVLDQLKTLEAQGVQLILCSTCLTALNLLDQVRVGIVGGMPDIMEAQFRATKVITL